MVYLASYCVPSSLEYRVGTSIEGVIASDRLPVHFTAEPSNYGGIRLFVATGSWMLTVRSF